MSADLSIRSIFVVTKLALLSRRNIQCLATEGEYFFVTYADTNASTIPAGKPNGHLCACVNSYICKLKWYIYNQALICLVESYQCLWDQTVEIYKNKILKQCAQWKEVKEVREMVIDDFQNKGEKEKQNLRYYGVQSELSLPSSSISIQLILNL